MRSGARRADRSVTAVVAMLMMIGLFGSCNNSGNDGTVPGDGTGSVEDAAAGVCNPGDIQKCQCSEGTAGTRTCLSDGTRWSECEECSIPTKDAGLDGDTEVRDGADDSDANKDAGTDAASEDGGWDTGRDSGQKDAEWDSWFDDTGDVGEYDSGRDIGSIDALEEAGHDIDPDARTDDTGAEHNEDSGQWDAGIDVGSQDTGLDACSPDCSGKCGGVLDGCGGTCDNCSSGHLCEGTSCVLCGDYGQGCCINDICSGTNVCNKGTCAAASCGGKPDFTLCKLVTNPDRWYDICVRSTCVSPGCGEATCNPPGPYFEISDTGHRKCFNSNASTEIPCPVAGGGTPCAADGTPAFCGQDAQYGWDTTHQPDERYDVSAMVTDQPVVDDKATGLVWQGCVAGRSGVLCDVGSESAMVWSDALTYCDSLEWGGRKDWRLPDRYELMSIQDYSKRNPTIDGIAFPQVPISEFWSSSTYTGTATSGWLVDFAHGELLSYGKAELWYVRCTRGAPTPRPTRFSRSEPVVGQPVVDDQQTKLVWQGCAGGVSGSTCGVGSAAVYTWQEALLYCESLTWAGESDWRLPNVEELTSIVDDQLVNPSVDVLNFPSTPATYFVSSSTMAVATAGVWAVSFGDGTVDSDFKTKTYNIRCVRVGP